MTCTFAQIHSLTYKSCPPTLFFLTFPWGHDHMPASSIIAEKNQDVRFITAYDTLRGTNAKMAVAYPALQSQKVVSAYL